MQNYKDKTNKIHALDSTDFEHLLPEGCVRITEEDAELLLSPPPPTPEKLREIAKQSRAEAVGHITVEVNGKVFDGDEVSQTRMARAIIGMQAAGVPTLTWVLADNTVTEATLAELTGAMVLAGQAQADVWVLP